MRKLSLLLLLSMIACASVASGAQAAIVTVGSPLTSAFESVPAGVESGTVADRIIGGSGAHATSPISGVIVRWHVLDAVGGPYALRVLRQAAGTSYTAISSSASVTSSSPNLESFETDLPIQAGDTVGLDIFGPSSTLGLSNTAIGSKADIWVPALALGATRSPFLEPEGEYAFNAEVQPPPTITSLGASSGPTSGGTSVTISGTDFEGASAVKFGASPASAFSVNSEGQITAVAPPGAAAVPVSVTTIAGSATSSQAFTYQAPTATPIPTCTVPKLKGKKLRVSKKVIRAADCKVGEVTKHKGVKAATGRVVGQSKKPGTVLAAGSVVKVTLGKG